MRNGGAANKNREAPQNFDSASRRRHLERSREIFLAERSTCQLRNFDHRLLLIPSYSSLLSNFMQWEGLVTRDWWLNAAFGHRHYFILRGASLFLHRTTISHFSFNRDFETELPGDAPRATPINLAIPLSIML